MKKTIKIILGPLLAFTMLTTTFASSPGLVVSNKTLPVRAVNQSGRVLVPLRAIFEALDATVDYDYATKTITGHKDGRIVILKINDKVASVDGEKITLDVPAKIMNGSTFVPVRFIGESLGASVVWDNNTVLINSDKVLDKTASVGTVQQLEIGRSKVMKVKNGMTLSKKSGPFSIKITDVQVSDLETSKAYKALYDNKDRLTMVTMAIEVQNTGAGTYSFNPDQGILSTNTKEYAQPNLMASDRIGGDFIGKSVQKGYLIFLLDSTSQDINKISYMIHAGFDDHYNLIGEDIAFEIEF